MCILIFGIIQIICLFVPFFILIQIMNILYCCVIIVIYIAFIILKCKNKNNKILTVFIGLLPIIISIFIIFISILKSIVPIISAIICIIIVILLYYLK